MILNLLFTLVSAMDFNSANQLSKHVVKVLTEGLGGTGFIVSRNYIITNDHVCRDSMGQIVNMVMVVDIKGREVIGQPVKYKQDHDLCLVRTKTRLNFSGVEFDKVKEYGEDVFSAGYPHLWFNTTFGKITGLAAYDQYSILVLRSNINCQPGSSGSPVFNKSGKVIGIVSAVDKAGCYLIPSKYIVRFYESPKL